MKKLINSLLIIALLIMQFVPTTIVKAANGRNDNTGTITISNAILDRSYAIYEVLKLESFDTLKEAYTYKATTEWDEFINSDVVKNIYVEVDDQGYVTWINNQNVVEFSKLALKYAKDNQIAATSSKEASSNQVSFTGLNLGWYLVDSSVGALCGLTTTKPTASLIEKNDEPTVLKEVKENTTGEYGSENDATIGDVIEYRTTINAKAGAENYVLHDTMDRGLTLDKESFKVKVAGSEVSASDGTYTIATTGIEETFRITFANSYMETLTKDLDTDDSISIVVEYKATINENAIIAGDSGNINSTTLDYGDSNTITSTTTTYTYAFDLIKTNESNEILEDATFKLYDANGNQIYVVLVDEDNGIYRVTTTANDVLIRCGHVTINGLDSGSYQLEEITPPKGYNKLATRKSFTINKTNLENSEINGTTYVSGGVQVQNNKGNLLPETGGMGTILFITIGSILSIVFGILLVTKLRASKEIE